MLNASSVSAELVLGSPDLTVIEFVNGGVGIALSGMDASAGHCAFDIRAAERRLP